MLGKRPSPDQPVPGIGVGKAISSFFASTELEVSIFLAGFSVPDPRNGFVTAIV